MSVQPVLFPQPSQPRARKREDEETYDAVLKLRRRGKQVYRHGRRFHSVDGERVTSDKLLIRLAEDK